MARGPQGQIKKQKKSGKKGKVKRAAMLSAASDSRPQVLSTWETVRCRISQDWETSGMAAIHVLQQREGFSTAYRLAGFLVDVKGLGLKDAFVHTNVSRNVMTQLDQRSHSHGMMLNYDSCSEDLARRLVFGGIFWARRWDFRTPPDVLKLTEKILGTIPNLEDDDLTEFGSDGKPFIIGDLDSLAQFLPPNSIP